ncbi:hypothetical protein ZHAS_00011198 [Anopheles sinensis]|uniref:Uncharacterized protein n=1 Tax=Anopheles sinensis TaxID=74873 RepID=A0A084VZK7_ANOSI|nr:hypothetical protein ZHAS_00011198 [Anopheles sinensis]
MFEILRWHVNWTPVIDRTGDTSGRNKWSRYNMFGNMSARFPFVSQHHHDETFASRYVHVNRTFDLAGQAFHTNPPPSERKRLDVAEQEATSRDRRVQVARCNETGP